MKQATTFSDLHVGDVLKNATSGCYMLLKISNCELDESSGLYKSMTWLDLNTNEKFENSQRLDVILQGWMVISTDGEDSDQP